MSHKTNCRQTAVTAIGPMDSITGRTAVHNLHSFPPCNCVDKIEILYVHIFHWKLGTVSTVIVFRNCSIIFVLFIKFYFYFILLFLWHKILLFKIQQVTVWHFNTSTKIVQNIHFLFGNFQGIYNNILNVIFFMVN